MNEAQLDNPVWYALSTVHRHLATGQDGILFYQPEFGVFGGHAGNGHFAEAIAAYTAATTHFFIVGNLPPLPASVQLLGEMVSDQMVTTDPIPFTQANEIVPLNEEHTHELYQLVNGVQPGYFMRRTPELGRYYGIFEQGQLVAVTGERMQTDRYTEISAVVTHPLHTGRGYAGQLVAHVVNGVLEQQKLPFLHVTETNTRAIGLYSRLGFRFRRKMSFWKMAANGHKER